MKETDFDEVENQLKLKITRINNRFHARLYLDSDVIDEMACQDKIDIAWICREMLRWLDKCGSGSKMAAAARARHNSTPKGRVWYKVQLEAGK